VILLSGGSDSATLLGLAAGIQATALSVAYGQRHGRELASAQALASHYGVEHETVYLPLFRGSALSHGSAQPNGPCVVHGRNLAFLSVGLAFAANVGASEVLFGATADDQADYPDCRREFVDALNATAAASGLVPRVVAPFIGKRKADVIRYGLAIGVPYQMTWTCYDGGLHPCGACNACKLRASAFAEAGTADPVT
jgi:7-cyano-7-deazaguanine synthase